jgi:enediyne biosynthesis protein E7
MPTDPPPLAAPCELGSTDDSLPRMVQDFAELGDLYRVHAPGRNNDTWVATDPDDIKRVLLTNHRNYTKGVGLDRVKILLGNGIMVSEGDFWQRQRRMIQPLFQRAEIERFGAMIAAVTARRLQAIWLPAARGGQPFNITKECSEASLEIVLRALLGTDLDDLTQELGHNPFLLVTEEAARDLRFAYRFRQLGKHIDALIERRLGRAERDDWLGQLLSARDRTSGEPMQRRELIDEVLTLIVAGHETTASTLNSTWYLLGTHPDVERALHAELDAHAPGDWSLQAMEALHYTQQVLLEALRLYPPGWLLTRRPQADDTLSGHRCPAGTDVFVSPYLVQRHPKHWPEPEKFCPARFADGVPSHRYAYIPFAVGPRHCVGETFAMYEMIIHLVLAARAFRLRLPNSDGPPELEARINLRTRADLLVTVERRAHASATSTAAGND